MSLTSWFRKPDWRHDTLASITVFLVALPLCIGISVASGLPAGAGLLGGVIGGLLVGLITGAPFLVHGPAAGLIAITWEVLHSHGLEGLMFVILMTGGLQVLSGLFKIAPLFRAVSPSVVQGMLCGIGLLIITSQFHVMFGLEPSHLGLDNILKAPEPFFAFFELPVWSPLQHSALIGLLTLAVLLAWRKVKGRLSYLPSALVAVFIASLVSFIFQLPIEYVDIPKDFIAQIKWENPFQENLLLNFGIWASILSLAFISSAESMLNAIAIDKRHKGSWANYNQTLMALGLGNIISSFVGGVPLAGVVERSAANVDSQAKTRWSAVFHGVWLLLFVLLLPQLLQFIPMASLAAVLIYTGFLILHVDVMQELWKTSKSEFAIMALTIVAIMVTHLSMGILIGFALSTLKLVFILNHCEIHIKNLDEQGMVIIDLYGSASFMTLPRLADELEKLPPGKEVHVFVSHTNYIDHACLEWLTQWQEQYVQNGGHVVLEWDHVVQRFKSPPVQSPTLMNR